MARENALLLGAYNISFSAGDLFAAKLPWPKVDLIAANPPYVPTAEIETLAPDVKDFEPRLALDGGPDGLGLLRRIVTSAPEHLAHGGVLALELGAEEADAVRRLLEQRGFVEISTTRDYGKIERVVSGVWHNG